MDVKKRGQHSWRETHTATESRRFSFIINAHGRKQLIYVLYNENIFFFTLHIYFMACCLVHVCLHFSHPFYLSFLPSTALTAHRLYSPVSSAITEVCQAIFLWRMAPRSYFTFSFSFFFFSPVSWLSLFRRCVCPLLYSKSVFFPALCKLLVQP